ncbi:MAG: toll/interleukin-1 receptor domain-containing protein [Polyangiaceae bacterium]|nr:toll/interleukin-1 receptor domain-containing protein [Polyangiaceae bacterium]
MPSFDYRQVPLLAPDRYPKWVVGSDQWAQQPGDILSLPLPPAPRLLPPRLFISHSQHDPDFAERIAWLADSRGFEYWLDIHDPLLSGGGPVPPRVVASTIEIALINCTHLLAVYTKNAFGSVWVPYEYGRAKDRLGILSDSISAWIPTNSTDKPSSVPDYLLLGRQFQVRPLHPTPNAEPDIQKWLDDELIKAGRLPGHGGTWTALPPLHLPA